MGSFLNKGTIINTDCGTRLKFIRLQKGWNQYELAEKVGFQQSYISKLEDGRRQFTFETAEKICTKLDIDFIWFLTGVERKV